jgi:hypothetical protein
MRNEKQGHCMIGLRANNRAIGCLVGDTVEWVWIGTHEQYHKLV